MEAARQQSFSVGNPAVVAHASIRVEAAVNPADDYVEAIERVAELLASSRSILFITGAGISADSGLPTYHGGGSFYDIDCSEDDLCVERAFAVDFFEDHPELTWKYLRRVERICQDARCNRAHEVIAEMERHFERVWTLTQNMDGLHRAAGARNVIDVHGDLHDLRCTRCRHRERVADYSRLRIPPECPECSSPLRPDILLFDEGLAPEKLMMMLIELDSGFDMVFTIGTTSAFPYVAEPIQMAVESGRPTVEINPEVSEVSDVVGIRLPLRAAPALDAVWQAYRRGVPHRL